jgi:hypothetical protein
MNTLVTVSGEAEVILQSIELLVSGPSIKKHKIAGLLAIAERSVQHAAALNAGVTLTLHADDVGKPSALVAP